MEHGVARKEYHTHAALPQLALNPILTENDAGLESSEIQMSIDVADFVSGDDDSRIVQEHRGAFRLREQRLDLLPQYLVTSTRLAQECCTLVGLTSQRVVKHVRNLLPAVRIHPRAISAGRGTVTVRS